MKNRSLLICEAEKGIFTSGRPSCIFSKGILVITSVTVHKSVVNHMDYCVSWEMLDGGLPSDLFNLNSDKKMPVMMGDFHLIR